MAAPSSDGGANGGANGGAIRCADGNAIPISPAAVATSLVHDLAASLALPGAVGGRLLVLLDILIGHVAVGSDDAVATTSTLPLREWRKVLLLVHTVYTGASSMHLSFV